MARRADLDRLKGLAILLVVFGHLVARTDPLGVSWYEPLRRAVYSFHMPLFLYVSGMVAVLSGQLLAPPGRYAPIMRARAQRLLVPFFGLGLLVVAGKLVFSRLIYVDHVPPGLCSGLLDLVWHTGQSPALSIWYLFVLFVLNCGGMLVLAGKASRLWGLLAAAMLLYAVRLPDYCYLDRIGGFALFFVLGAWAGTAGGTWEAVLRRHWKPALSLFCVGLGGEVWLGTHWPPKLPLLIFGALAMPALHGAVKFSRLASSRILLFLGRYSFSIYLLNTIFIGATKGILLRFFSWDGEDFLPFSAALLAAGILGPIAAKITLRRYVPVLDRLAR